MWGLPALLQRFHLPSVRVYATEPTLRLGRLLVQEFHHYHAQAATVSPTMFVPVTTRTPVDSSAIGAATGLGGLAVPPALAPLLGTGTYASGSVLQAPYTPAELAAAWARVTTVSLNEPVWLSPMWTARAVASGSSLGAVGWELVALSPTPGWSPSPPVPVPSVHVSVDVDAGMDSHREGDGSRVSTVTATGTAALSTFRVLYLSRASGQTRRVPRCLDLDALCVPSAETAARVAQNSPGRATVPDVLLLDDLSRQRAPPAGGPPPTADQALLEVGRLVVATVKAGGSVLLPIQADGGNCLDVLEHVCAALIAAMYLSVPVYVISPVMGEVLSTAAVFSEWMNDSRQERVRVSLQSVVLCGTGSRGCVREKYCLRFIHLLSRLTCD
jgi:Cft2 family RNA processing exonuclease